MVAPVAWILQALVPKPLDLGLEDSLFSFHRKEVDPFPFYVSEQLLAPSFFDELDRDFPDAPEHVTRAAAYGGARSIVRNEPAYDELLARSAAYRRLHDYVFSQRMVDVGMKLFGEHLARDRRCVVDPSKAFFADHLEIFEKRRPNGLLKPGQADLRPAFDRRRNRIGDPNELYVVLEFFHGVGNMTGSRHSPTLYQIKKHIDYPMRVMSILLYFTDTSMATGGTFEIYEGADGRHLNETIEVKRNSAISHLSPHPEAWHAVPRFTQKDQYRRVIQIQISSKWSVCREGTPDDFHMRWKAKKFKFNPVPVLDGTGPGGAGTSR